MEDIGEGESKRIVEAESKEKRGQEEAHIGSANIGPKAFTDLQSQRCSS